ncbi:sigma-54-dependent transcriptional regulator [Solitalea koreensis]|uniref:Two-component system, NtrC family, response regulator HydG n=1 Tax=Solitalea koreensis TaxID=543615 RepID=A0A521BXQ2_9SPHI|nr:sigma-54 dependent transcriptional regulator [Solitalea koreensis]SMO51974.1 two-component system, NtrC family, response regulator HydG [Solitalea koreensis]
MKNILIIDDEVNIGVLLTRFLSKHGFGVNTANSGSKAMELLKNNYYDLVLCDYRLEDTDGRQMLTNILELHPTTMVIIITGYSDVKIAVEMVKNGAYDYISKPLYPDEILSTINKALEIAEVRNDTQANTAVAVDSDAADTNDVVVAKTAKPARGKPALYTSSYIMGECTAAKELYRQISLVAPTNYSVILFGESGTGKESVANMIHMNSSRKDKPFIPLDCGSLSKELAGSELFGHEKGSFTGAFAQKIGHFEMANGGTIFLDEVANLSYETQVSLLRVIQERRVKRIGGIKEIDLDVRILVASNENLWEAVQKGRFREDLYHRFNEFSIVIPPLRQRGSDLMLFAEHFLAISSKELNKHITGFSPEVVSYFMNYSWPGNIRELKNVVRRAALLTEDERMVEVKSLPLELSEAGLSTIFQRSVVPLSEDETIEKPAVSANDLKAAAQEAEQDAILKVLRQVNFNKTKAAAILNIDRKTLYNKMKGMKLN